MKRPRQTSTESDLLSGSTSFAPDGAFLGSKRNTITPAQPLRPGDVVVCGLDDRTANWPLPAALGSCYFYGARASNGDIHIYLSNPTGTAIAAPEIFINWMVLPQGSTPI